MSSIVSCVLSAASAQARADSATTPSTAKHPASQTSHAAVAQPAPAKAQRRLPKIEAPRSEEVVVTGSYLGARQNSSANPVQIVTAKQIQATSAVTIGDYLQRLPSIGSTGAQNTNPQATSGMSCADIRNIGQSRVLVLIDGKRQTQSMAQSFSCVDLNSLPVDQIASVEILKDGGSELYGADAVSGVINIKLKHNVTDANISVRGGITSFGDDHTGRISAHKGFNFDHDRGNITIFGQYMTQGGILERDRPWSQRQPINNPPAGGTMIYGSSLSQSTRVDPNGMNLVANGNGGFSPYNTSYNYNFVEGQSMVSYLQTGTLAGDAHYTVNRHFDLYANVNYTHKASAFSMSGLGVQGSSYPSPLSSSIWLPEGNPYNTFGKTVALYKRFSDIGTNPRDQAQDTYQVTAGAKGEIFDNWRYDASMAYGMSQATFSAQNDINYAHLLQELGTRQTQPGNASSPVVYDPTICSSQPGCVLANPFVPWSGHAAKYLVFTEHDHANYQLRDFNLRVNNNKVVKLPYKGGGNVGLAFGMEHHSEQGSYSPDPLIASGDAANTSSVATGGGFNATEVYLEGQLPLLHNVFLAKDLTIDGQGRWSDYNTFGSTTNWKGSINWAPTEDIRFRATLGTSYRQPSIYELYGGQQVSLAFASDPCGQVNSYGSAAATVLATCRKYGVDPAHFTPSYSGELPVATGGNSHLHPETGRTYTIGTVVTPHWIPGLSASVEYWHYTIRNMITSITPQYILDSCYTGSNTAYCSDITPRTSTGQINTVDDLYQNIGGLRTNGIDFDLNYRFQLTDMDAFSISNNYQQLIGYLQQNQTGGAWLNYTGRLIYSTGHGMPHVRDYATATWAHGLFTLTYMMNFTGGMIFNNGTSDLRAATSGTYKVSDVVSHDITLGYRLRNWTFQAGINNFMNRKPPFVPTAAFNTATGVYGSEIIGRYVWLQAGVTL
ncbi:TonB-dependent receptor plug domain-containing protein [Gluconacetobacter sacchari]|uniref:TonB-dependent receptor plug domain-containing protein n=1 Tax=Gluconacetobacter sacchari TaxID=92759 RepID=UPI0039B5E345